MEEGRISGGKKRGGREREEGRISGEGGKRGGRIEGVGREDI